MKRKERNIHMHLKRLYKALAIVITVAMILPQTWVWTFAENEAGGGEVVAVTEEVPAPEPPAPEAPEAPTPETPAPETPETPTPEEVTPTPEEVTPTPEEVTPTPEEVTPTPTEEPEERPVLEDPEPTPGEGQEEVPTDDIVRTEDPATSTQGEIFDSIGFGSNSALIAAQEIVMPSIAVDKYRFSTIEKVYAVARENVIIREEQDAESREVGKLQGGGLCYIIQEIDNSEWVYVESDTVRGFMKEEYLITGEEVNTIIETNQEENMELAVSTLDPLDNKAFTFVKETVYETKAEKVYAIAGDSVNILEGKIEEDQEEEQEDVVPSRILGELPQGGLCYILAEDEDGWLFVESEDVRGFVRKDWMTIGAEAEELLANSSTWTEEEESNLLEQEELLNQQNEELEAKEAELTQAEEELAEIEETDAEAIQAKEEEITALVEQINGIIEEVEKQTSVVDELKVERHEAFGENIGETPGVVQLVDPEDNRVFYYTVTSTKEISVSDSIGRTMVEFASQFLGNPYVWGGTSLTNGADCSGFVQGIYSQFGYSIPRTSGEQAQVGMKIPVSEARIGDLIFYARNGVIYHVVMYTGEGKVIHASSTKTGIIVSGIDEAHAVWATRMISDDDQDKVEAVNAKAGIIMYGGSYTNATAADKGELLGNFKLTAYCNCVLCCGKWAGGPTASGTMPVEGRTVAMAGVPFGTKLIINDKVYTVEDRGTPYGHVDIYMNDHDECNVFGVQYADVYAAQ